MFRNVLGEDTVMNLKEFKQYGGNLDEDVASNLKEVVNLYGIKVATYTEYDKQPKVDPIFGDISYRVGLFVKEGRVLHGCTYSHSEDEWYYNGKSVPKPQIVRWWYEEDKIYEV